MCVERQTQLLLLEYVALLRNNDLFDQSPPSELFFFKTSTGETMECTGRMTQYTILIDLP